MTVDGPGLKNTVREVRIVDKVRKILRLQTEGSMEWVSSSGL